MNILLIPDKFKGSLTAEKVIESLSTGILRNHSDAKIFSVLASDGGDGFLDAINKYNPLEKISEDTLDPLGRKINTYYLFDAKNGTAYIELAKASGIELLTNEELDVMETSTAGTGIQIKHALAKGAKKIVIGLGGSATNDGGTGMADILGYRFLDFYGNDLTPCGRNLERIAKILINDDSLIWADTEFIAVNDVTNPLYGEEGAAHVYAKQKGANSEEIESLDAGLRHLATIVQKTMGIDIAKVPGTGAAGGTGYGLKSFFNAQFINGIDFLFQLAGIPELLERESIDYIITGEGKLDQQTLHGKLIKGVMDIANQHGIPLIAICGISEVDIKVLKNKGLKDVLEIHDPAKTIKYSMDNASGLIENTIFKYFSSL
ncbi:glycerate kinase [uncultured Eudoraea sp.]|uniref:glycerate kinase n=1 Tax=uncultured Eudoraea sp. TaxID=1035614 RepID=UPI00261D3E8C|nr:glycerate kinase [uncultured Eudoraea sp.]